MSKLMARLARVERERDAALALLEKFEFTDPVTGISYEIEPCSALCRAPRPWVGENECKAMLDVFGAGDRVQVRSEEWTGDNVCSNRWYPATVVAPEPDRGAVRVIFDHNKLDAFVDVTTVRYQNETQEHSYLGLAAEEEEEAEQEANCKRSRKH